jgi:DNA-binding IclR family transcriptional regulator
VTTRIVLTFPEDGAAGQEDIGDRGLEYMARELALALSCVAVAQRHEGPGEWVAVAVAGATGVVELA